MCGFFIYITLMIIRNIHTHIPAKDAIRSFSFGEIHEALHYNAPFSIGIHPWETGTMNCSVSEACLQLEHLLNRKNCLAVGECGLDKLKGASLEEQIEILSLQLALAEKTGKPVIIHCVKAFNELITLKKEWMNIAMVIHGFRSKIQVAQMVVRQGIKLSFGTYLLNSPSIQEIYSLLPDTETFLETDEQDPTEINKLIQFAAKLKNVSLEAFEKKTERNTHNFFDVKL